MIGDGYAFLTILIGFLYGALKRGKQPKGELLRTGIFVGFVVGIFVAVLYALADRPGLAVAGFVGWVVTGLLAGLFFILGVWLGDLVTGRR